MYLIDSFVIGCLAPVRTSTKGLPFQLRHQVILDADIDHFGHPDAGPALMHAAVKFPAEPPSDNDSA